MAVATGNKTKHRLVYTLETQVNESETSAYRVGEQRERNHRYYSLEPLGNEVKGRSHYISPDVLDAVEGKKAIFSETFLSNRNVIEFTDCSYPDEGIAKTEYVNKVFRMNQYESLFRDAWHDAFVAKRCVMLAEWTDDTKETDITTQQTPVPLLNQQLQQMGDVMDVDTSQAQMAMLPMGPMGQGVPAISGPITVVRDDSHVKLTLVPPERYFRDPDVAYGEDGAWRCIEEDVPRGVLLERGYDEEQVMKLQIDYRFRSDEEDAARKAHDHSWTRRRQHNRIPEQEQVSFYRTWTWLRADEELFADLELSFEPANGYRLYEIHWTAGEVLMWADGTHAVKELQEVGIFEWSEMKVSHAENGLCTADVVAHTQKTTSALKRLIIDNQNMANASRVVARVNGLKNPRDLLDNKIGTTLWANMDNAVVPLPQPMLSPLTMDTLAMMKSDSEERSGISGLAKGMNTDAVKYQNADNMIDRLTTAGQRRVTMAARDFANSFLVPLAQFIAHTAMREDEGSYTAEIQGRMIQITPSQWQDEDLTVDVATALTPDEGQRMAQQLLMLNTMLSQDPQMALSYGMPQKHALYDMVFDLIGISDTSNLMLPPQSQQFQQAAQAQQQQMQQAQQKQDQLLGFQLQTTQQQIGLAQSADRREWQKFQWNQTQDVVDNTLDQDKQDWTEDKEQQELDIEREQKRAVAVN